MAYTTQKTANNYPQTNEPIVPGDILYSSKGWSTFLVGHVGIVGPDLLIYHSHPRGGFAESLRAYLSRHKFGGTLTVFRPRVGAEEAAMWAQNNIPYVKRYLFDPKLNNVSHNYCSKFVWQAFWYAQSWDITSRKLTDKRKRWVYPANIKYSWNLQVVAKVEL
ncbi:hypothetical protein [Aquibacillus sediminis]|uniref:hypothetical protein n=1 Tax=Aquibacillus sediminis TaxID=2574734 RepID=UPI001109AB1D|nr:hypothetical protein [Aquibacillus sediminis]